ncbi:MAG: CRTAC1 family protein [Pyrinomonadaceae bacterium]
MKYLPKILLSVFFAGLLAVPFLMRRYYQPAAVEVDSATAMKSFGFFLEDVAAKSGINFRHQSPKLDPKLGNIMPIIASMGAAVSIVDYDRDGWNDIYLTNSGEGSKNALYRNLKDGTFSDVAEPMGVADLNQIGTGVSMGTVWADYDNDGFEDLFLYKWGKPELFHNDAGQGFTRTTDGSGLPEWTNANTAVWFDYDRDGKIDLFVGGYFPEGLNLWNVESTLIMPESFEYAKNGGRKYLFHNLGSGKFEEVSKKLGIDSNRWALAAGAADIRGTGYPDLFVANDYGVAELYLNENGERFVEAGEKTGVGFAPKSGMNATFGDVLNQGKFAIYVSNISEPGILLQGNNLWMQKPNSKDLAFENQASSFGVEFGGWSWGSQFADLNNDGNQDIFLTNGYISGDQAENYWYDYAKVTVGNNSIISDTKNWAPIGGRSLAGFQAKKVWLNDGSGRFSDVARAVGVNETFDGRSVATADLWNRGVVDIVVANQNGPVVVYKNSADAANNWIAFDLEGTASNTSSIGAQVRVFWNGQQQVQEVSGGIGFCSQNQRRLQFGIGKTNTIDKVEIRWPSGKVVTIESPEVNKVHSIKET